MCIVQLFRHQAAARRWFYLCGLARHSLHALVRYDPQASVLRARVVAFGLDVRVITLLHEIPAHRDKFWEDPCCPSARMPPPDHRVTANADFVAACFHHV